MDILVALLGFLLLAGLAFLWRQSQHYQLEESDRSNGSLHSDTQKELLDNKQE